MPWLTRPFSKLRDVKYADKQFFNTDFSDIEISPVVKNHLDKVDGLHEVIAKYQKLLSACQKVKIRNGTEEEAFAIVWQSLSTYATFRKIGSDEKQ